VTDTLSPGSSGELVDPDGQRWTVRKRRLDPRTVRRLLKRHDGLVLFGEAGGFQLRWIPPAERPALWERVRHCYAVSRSGRPPGDCAMDYTGYEFTTADQRRLLYLEESC
jgi:cell wall assembly regulator SMI1